MMKTSELKETISIKSFTTLRNAYLNGDLPRPIRLSTHSIVWDKGEIRTWMLSRPKVKSYPKLIFNIPEVDEKTDLKFISLREVLELTTIRSPTTIYEWMKKGEFPAHRQILQRKVGWLKHEIMAWMAWRKKHI